ncbi:MAG: protein kinase [Alphaproteobacteria bacterium]|nr:protein kinase [Alphaproteobacteria bacterium]
MSGPRRYHLLEPVGRGSFGTVYRATMEAEGGFSKEVALKILKPEVASQMDMTSRLRDEARLLGLLRHRAILQVDGLVFIEGRWAVVMEYIEGVSLHEATSQARMPLGVSLEILAEISSALNVAYNQPGPDGRPLHLIHRDIKPANIRITASGGVKVLDFGIARANYNNREAETGSLLMGSFGYMSPERLDSIDGPEGDIYALGVVLYEMVVGERLGKTSSNLDRHASFHRAALKRFERIVGEPGAEATDLLGRMLSYRIGDRPNARELEIACRRIARALNHESLSEWAGRIVPFLMNSTPPGLTDDDSQLTGMTLAEQRPSWDRMGEAGMLGDPTAALPGRFDFENDTFPMDELPTASLMQFDLPTPLPPLYTDPTPSEPPELLEPLEPLEPLVVTGPDVDDQPLRRLLLLIVGMAALLAALALVAVISSKGASRHTGGTVHTPAPPAEPAADMGDDVRFLQVGPIEPVMPDRPRNPPPATAPTKAPGEDPVGATAPAPAQGRVTVTGDPVKLVLEGPNGKFSPGRVPAGTYTIRATFEGREPLVAGQIEVVQDTTLTLKCNATFARCMVSR